MGTPDRDLVHELAAVERARRGEHGALVELYRQDAPPAWRLALALTGDPAAAEEAVAEGFRRTLAPLRAPLPTTEVPFRVRLLAATRHAVLDGAPSAEPAARPTRTDARPSPRDRPAAAVMAAFGALPEQWRTVLWLVVVEGLGSLDAARVLDLSPADTEELAQRARAGLDARWARDRQAEGTSHPVVPAHLDRQLQPVLPLPAGLFAVVERRWRGSRHRDRGPLGLALPGGRPVPRWAERALVGTTAALIALGITGALTVDGDPGRRGPTISARPDAPRGAGDDEHDGGPGTTPSEPNDGGAATALGTGAVTPHRVGPRAAAHGPVRALGGADPTAVRPAASGDDEGGEDPPAPPKPLLEATAGTGSSLGVRAGTRCTGMELSGRVTGCEPATKPTGVTADVESSVLPGL